MAISKWLADQAFMRLSAILHGRLRSRFFRAPIGRNDVTSAADGAGDGPLYRSGICELDPALADPARSPPRNAGYQRKVRNIPSDHGSSADERVAANGDAADDGGISSYRSAAHDQRLAVLILSRDVAPRIDDVGEYHAWATEDIVLDRYAFVDGDVVLDADVVAEDGATGDENALTEGAAFTDLSI